MAKLKIKQMEGIIEAILFTMGDSVEVGKIARALEQDEATTRKVIHKLMDKYAAEDRGIRIIELDGAYQMCTKTEMYEYLIRVASQPKKHVLTDVLLETLSIIAYKQPVTKLEIEKIRGVKSDHAVKKEDVWTLRENRSFSEQRKNSCAGSVFIRWMICQVRIRNR